MRILFTVCHESTVNVGAIYSLVSDTKEGFHRKGMEWRHDMFLVNKKEVLSLFDVPHLLKRIRNNLLNQDIHYVDIKDGNKIKIVTFKYFKMIYEADQSFGELRILHSITEEHVTKDKIRKMEVELAAQLFSHSMAVAIEHLSFREIIPQECRDANPLFIVNGYIF